MTSIVKALVLSSGLALLLGTAFLPSGCGSSRAFNTGLAPPGDAEIPGPVAQQLTACAEEHRSHLGFAQHALSFELQFSEDGQVDEVALKDSTLEDQGLEACMAGVLRSLSMDDLPMRRSENGSRDPVVPESRALLGQEEVFLCLASPPCLLTLGLFVGAAFLTVQIYVHAAQSSTIAKPWAGPMATSVPTVAPVDQEDEYEKRCRPLFDECLENMNQPAWNQKDYGAKKNCLGCYRECKFHSKPRGIWPDYKCPRR